MPNAKLPSGLKGEALRLKTMDFLCNCLKDIPGHAIGTHSRTGQNILMLYFYNIAQILG